MGYIRRDFSAPTIAKWQYNLKFKNTILKHWPTRLEGTTKVFAPLYIYQNGVGIYKTPAHLKIYKLLGIKIKDLEAGQYDGIENTYMHVPGINLSYDILATQIQSYIEANSPQIYPLSKDPFNVDPIADTRLNPDPYRDNPEWVYDVNGIAVDSSIPEPQWDKDGWITTYLTYTPPVKADVPASISDTAILWLIEAGDRNSIHFDDEEDHPLTFVSLLDTSNILFENTTRIVQKTIEERTTNTYVLNRGNLNNTGSATSNYLKTAVIEYKFRRVKDASDPLVATLITKIDTELNALSIKMNAPVKASMRTRLKQPNTFGVSENGSVSKQLIRMYHAEVTTAETTLSYNGYLKYEAMKTQKAKDFGKIFSKQITQGHTLKKVKWYKKALSVVISIITVVVAVVLIMSGNLVGAAMVLSFGALLQSGLAYYWSTHGDPAAANYAMGHAEFLGTAAMVVGIFDILSRGVERAAIEAAKQAVLAATKGTDLEIVGTILTSDFSISTESLSDIMTAGIKALNMGFSMYASYIDPSMSDLEDKKAELEASKKELEDTAGPEKLDTIEVEYSDPYNNWIDMNEKMQSMVYLMTLGKNRMLMNKYYNSGY